MPRRPMNREQAWLLPPSLDDLVPGDHAARFVAAFVDELDMASWRELGVEPEGERLGAPSYPPEALLSVWLYGFMTGVRSSRKLEAACCERIPFVWLAGRHRPDHNTLWRFYQAHRDDMRALFRRTVRIAVKADLVDLALQAVDGTKVASASRSRSLDGPALARLLKRTDAAIADLEAQNATGGDPAPPRLPRELAGAWALRERVKAALAQVEEDGGPQRTNLTDPDAVILKSHQGYVAGYSAQAMASPARPGGGDGSGGGMFITGAGIAAGGDEGAQLMPMIEEAAANTGAGVRLRRTGTVTLADAAYHSGANLAQAAREGRRVLVPATNDPKRSNPYDKSHFRYRPEIDAYICPEGQTLNFSKVVRRRGEPEVRRYRAGAATCRSCPALGACTTNMRGRTVEAGLHELLLSRHRLLMDTRWARALYKKRGCLIEPVFGILKEQQAARRFLLRGTQNVRAEWSLIATAFNLRTLYRTWRKRLSPQPANRPATAMT